ncbi:MAG: hypothetical protein OIF50_13925, partial [Flavobacteriaceae bacterium]|nr:hypothetical protein [Flavobacteriaceae bacterium]
EGKDASYMSPATVSGLHSLGKPRLKALPGEDLKKAHIKNMRRIDGLVAAFAAAEIVVGNMKKVMDKEDFQHFIAALERAKCHGVKVVRMLLQQHKDKESYGYTLEPFSMNTINEMFRGGFKTMQEMDDFESDNFTDNKVLVLIKTLENKTKKRDEYYIEAIFI